MIGENILHYKIIEELGRGGMGIVYKAEDNKLKREVAIKFLPHNIAANYEERQRFEIEAQAAASLNHPNITTIHAIEEYNNDIFIVMEYVDGIDLKEKFDSSPDINAVINVAIQISDGLDTAHKKGIIHRDIKPQNILITEDYKVKIMDFGLAKIAGRSSITKGRIIIGSTTYMSPEQGKGEELDYRTDIFSFGTVLYEILAGKPPFTGEYDQAIIYSIINEDPLPVSIYNSTASPILTDLISKCLEKRKEDRYDSFSSIKKELQSLQKKEIYIPEKKKSEKIEFTATFPLQKNELCVGREEQLKILEEVFNSVKRGEGKTVFINGEPGIGKTQLIACAIRNNFEKDFNVLYGRCLFNNEGSFPYHPFINSLKRITNNEENFVTKVLNAASGSGINISHRIPLIENFLNLSSDRSVSLLHKEQLWDAILILFKTIAVSKPLLLILDDIQWADKVSIGLLSYFARNIQNVPIALIGVHRPPETVMDFDTTGLIELIRQLNIEDLSINIALQRLSENETLLVINRLFKNQPVEKKLIAMIFRQSEGNPLFINELVNLFIEKELVEYVEGFWKLKKKSETEIVSKKVEDVIRQRIDYLDEKTREILQVASCEGEYFQSDILSGVLGIKRIELLKLLQSLEKENKIIRSENKLYKFDHILIREVLYDSIIPELKEEYHNLIAKWLIENYQNKDEYALKISHHLINAGLEKEAIEFLLRAANWARDLYAVEEALNNYNKLINIISRNDIDEERYKIFIEEGLGDVYITLGKSEDALQHYQNYLKIAQSRQDNYHIIKSLRKLGECTRVKGNIVKAEELCNEALVLAEKINNTCEILETLNTLALVYASSGNYKQTIETSEKALNIAEELSDEKNKSISLANLGFAYWHLGNYPVAHKKFDDALSIQRSLGDNRGLSTTLNFLGMVYWKLGKYEDALNASEESVEIKNKIADYRKIPGSLNVIGDIYRDIGDIKNAISYHKKSLGLATEHQNKGAMCDNLRDLGEDYFLIGDMELTLYYYKEVQKLASSSNIKWYETRTYISFSEYYLTSGELEEAKINIKLGMQYSSEIGAQDLIIEALWNMAKIKAAENLYDECNELFRGAISRAEEIGHQTFLWKLLYDYSNFLSLTDKKREAANIYSRAKEIVSAIYNNLKNETLKDVYISSEKIKELVF